MTLIAAIVEPGNPPFLVSDIALSGGSKPIETTQIPMQMGVNESFINIEKNSNDKISGLAQKTVVFGPHAVLWSGRYLEAVSLIKYLVRNSDRLDDNTFLDLVIEHYEGDEIGLSLIYGHAKPKKFTSISCINCETYIHNDRIIYAAGSGAVRFVKEYNRENKMHAAKTTFQELSARLARMYQHEIEDPNAYGYAFGVAYEVSTAVKEVWEKLPYCFSLFGHSEKYFGLKRTISTSYHRKSLVVTTSLFETQANTTDESNWIFLPKQVMWKNNFVSFIHSDYNTSESEREILNDFKHDAKICKQEAVFSVALVEIHSNDNSEAALYGRISNLPAAIGVVLRKNGYHLASKAFFRRNVEEHFLGRKFCPPLEYEAFYINNRNETLLYGPVNPDDFNGSK